MLKFLQPIASLLARVNIESSIAIASLRLFELLTRKVELTEEWAAAEKKRTEIAIGELLTNFKHWSDGISPFDVSDVQIPMGLTMRMNLALMFAIFQICWLI